MYFYSSEVNPHPISSFKNNFLLLPALQPIGIYPGKYQWAGQPNLGDCSLEILEANITFDDGLWECQVTSSSFASQDALASKPARLVVRGELRNFSRDKSSREIPRKTRPLMLWVRRYSSCTTARRADCAIGWFVLRISDKPGRGRTRD